MSKAFRALTIGWAFGSLFGALGCGGEEPHNNGCKSQQDCTLPQICRDDGQCVAPDPATESAPCLHAAHCASGSCLDFGSGAVCAAPCEEPAACGADRNCGPVAATAVDAEQKVLYLLCTEASPGQVKVLRGSPWLYELRYPQACGPEVAVVDMSGHGLANGRTISGGGELTSSCGGGDHEERVHLFRLDTDPHKLKLSVQAHGFEPVLYVRKNDCADVNAEVNCALGEDQSAALEIESPGPGAYYIVVDGADGNGRYELTLAVQTEPPQ